MKWDVTWLLKGHFVRPLCCKTLRSRSLCFCLFIFLLAFSLLLRSSKRCEDYSKTDQLSPLLCSLLCFFLLKLLWIVNFSLKSFLHLTDWHLFGSHIYGIYSEIWSYCIHTSHISILFVKLQFFNFVRAVASGWVLSGVENFYVQFWFFLLWVSSSSQSREQHSESWLNRSPLLWRTVNWAARFRISCRFERCGFGLILV